MAPTFPPPQVRLVLSHLRSFCHWCAFPETATSLREMSPENWLDRHGGRLSPLQGVILLTDGQGLKYIDPAPFKGHEDRLQGQITRILDEMDRERSHAKKRLDGKPRSIKFKKLLARSTQGHEEACRLSRQWFEKI